MKPTLLQLRSVCPEVDEGLIREHLGRLSEEYFERFDIERIRQHLGGLSRLSSTHPVETLFSTEAEGVLACTVLGFDYPAEFSLIAGLLFGMGVDVISGDVFTYERRATDARLPRKSTALRGAKEKSGDELLRRRRIVDHFLGTLDTDLSFERWTDELNSHLERVLSLLEQGNAESTTEAKHLVNEMVTRRLMRELEVSPHPVLYPAEIDIDNESGPFTRLRVVSQDTPAFLYALSTALSLQSLSIEHIRIRTTRGRIEDEIDFVNRVGAPVHDPELLDQIKLSALLTKQFTYFLDKAPDPYTALSRYEQLVGNILRLPERGEWLELVSNSHAMRDLARLLGASDYLWEDFIRLQYEALLPILKPHVEEKKFSEPQRTLPEALQHALEDAKDFEQKCEQLNRFKDHEIFLIDLDHILRPGTNFRSLSERLTVLAEHVVRAAVTIVYDHLIERYGHPRTVGGMEASYAILALGKLGGKALGYASDIELVFVYDDNGETDGTSSISNAEFFGHLARDSARFIKTKREGIFEVDLRLRPYGSGGPLASSLENFCSYFSPVGPAHSFERLAMVRLRAIGGHQTLGAQVERLRDEFIYESESIDVNELTKLRARQFKEKTQKGAYNAKFSPGALVDLEYTVQILQVLHGKQAMALRTPSIHEALDALEKADVVSPEEGARLVASYQFLRSLINGLRMLRGSARDLLLPPADSDEYVHLARRMGYQKQQDLEPEQLLHLDFETHTAAVRTFVERHLGRDSLPTSATGNAADLVLSDQTPLELRKKILSKAGFKNVRRAYTNLRSLARAGRVGDAFARLAVLACDQLRHEPHPDMALNNWERFVGSLKEPAQHFEVLLSQHKRLEILLGIFSRSQFLADTLIRYPDFFDWVTSPENLHQKRRRETLERELRKLAKNSEDNEDYDAWLCALRRFRRREILRIGTRDMYLGVSTVDVISELSVLAEAIVQVALEGVWRKLQNPKDDLTLPKSDAAVEERFCVLAFGKLGGRELNYSSDIDLIGIYDDAGMEKEELANNNPFARVMAELQSALTAHTAEGYVYRVDLRLRPYGQAGDIVSSVNRLEAYYQNEASLWEIQALLKLRPVAGNVRVGYEVLERVYPLLSKRRAKETVIQSVQKMREAAVGKLLERRLRNTTDVKNSLGGLRDVEFLVQGLQLMYSHKEPALLNGNTLEGLAALEKARLLPSVVASELREEYIFLRRVEHHLQILEDRQIHALPSDPAELMALAKRMLGTNATAEDFLQEVNDRLERVHAAYAVYISTR